MISVMFDMPAIGILDAKPHTAVYMMHKYFARRPWNIFSELVSHYSSPGELILDPFSGGGVTIIEALRVRRKAIGIDVNPLAIFITEMETQPFRVERFKQAVGKIGAIKPVVLSFYTTRCPNCGANAYADWIEWDEAHHKMARLKFDCAKCGGNGIKSASRNDHELARKIDQEFDTSVEQGTLWFPQTTIPAGDKTNSLIGSGITRFSQLFTKRNLLSLGIILKEISRIAPPERDLLRFTLSSCLKWASRMSHLRGKIVEGWALHAYWIYPKSLEINVWNTLERRVRAVIRGKLYSNREIGDFCKFGRNFSDLERDRSCLLLNQSAASLPFPDNSIDAIITDPPYGGNVNYGELSDFWWIWLARGKTIEKMHEAVVNRTQQKMLHDYEMILARVFSECFRVLKPKRYFVSTFNSKDARVVSGFLGAVSNAGFRIIRGGVQYQKPIKAYATTFHAMQVGAFVGDFIFVFTKPDRPTLNAGGIPDLDSFKRELNQLISEEVASRVTESELRERAYQVLIPFIVRHSLTSPDVCSSAADFFEARMRGQSTHFRNLRQTIIESRRRTFSSARP